jgi:hypothetical protein
MTVRGVIKKGKVLLDNPCGLPDGTEVEVRPVKKSRKPAKPSRSKQRPRSLAARLRNVIGKANGLPPDASVNVDHYLYGLSKRQ